MMLLTNGTGGTGTILPRTNLGIWTQTYTVANSVSPLVTSIVTGYRTNRREGTLVSPPRLIAVGPTPDAYVVVPNRIRLEFDRIMNAEATNAANYAVFNKVSGVPSMPGRGLTVTMNASNGHTIVWLDAGFNQTTDILRAIATYIEPFTSGKIRDAKSNALVASLSFPATGDKNYWTNAFLINAGIGGVVNDAGGGVKVTVGAGALPVNAWVNVDTSMSAELLAKVSTADGAAGTSRFLEPITAENFVRRVTGFDSGTQPVLNLGGAESGRIVEFKYRDDNGDGIVDGTGVSVDLLAVYVLNESTSRWERLESKVDKITKTVTAVMNGLGVIVTLLSSTETVEFEPLSAANPYNPADGDLKLTAFMKKNGWIRVTVLDILGRIVRRLEPAPGLTKLEVRNILPGANGRRIREDEMPKWDGKNGRGDTVADGVYVIVFEREYEDGEKEKPYLWKQAVLK